MARVEPLTPQDMPEFKDLIGAIGTDHGYVPNSFLTLGRHPALLDAMGKCADALWYDDRLPQPLRRLTGFAFSLFSGAMYSAAHLAFGAEELGLAREKLLSVHDYETAPVYSDGERAVLRLCRHAARMPGEVTDADMRDMERHFDDGTILLIVGLIAWHAFLNRWNDTMATRLEDKPRRYAQDNLQPVGWTLGKHG
ncbi:carboxymuconolactone decarboxylase family protein [Rhizobium leguminosarum]|uniref:carboxymuconolactone decarboxylase family protein n=1 Tax=Rhizobium leguminosarum TaxID=384 RepID=UPI0024A9CCD7|nr:carboxymuconolactone decarboxylase family protein [Rhizobium leguminosarum]MDI5929168.1 carboxymuconolactone decarboxylase family protein [Rhizobium leguminosarum]